MSKKIAHYLRVSTEEQELERQLSDSGKEMITGADRYKEKDSGRISFFERSKASQLVDAIKEGVYKEVHVHSLDRLGRNTLDIMKTIQFMTDNGVCLVSKKEGIRTLNEDGTENLISKMIVGILSTLAEWDINAKRDAQLEGIAVAKAKGKYKGRKKGSVISDEKYLKKYRKVVKCLEAKNSYRDTAKLCEVSLSTVQNVAERMKHM